MSYFFKQKWWAVAIVLVLIVNIGTLVLLWMRTPTLPTPPEHARAGHLAPPDYLPKQLHFSNQQQQQYTKLFMDHEHGVMSLKESIRVAKEDLFSLLKTDKQSLDEINRRAQRAAFFQQRLDVLTFEHFQQLKNICTPEQQKNFDKVIQAAIRHMAPPPPPPPPPGSGQPHSNQEDAPPPPPPGD